MSKRTSLIADDDEENANVASAQLSRGSFAHGMFEAGNGHAASSFTSMQGSLESNTRNSFAAYNMNADEIPISRHRPSLMRRASTRRSQRSVVPRGSMISSSMTMRQQLPSGAMDIEGFKPSALGSFDSIDEGVSTMKMPMPPGRASRQASWYQDALGQGITAEQMAAFLGTSVSTNEDFGYQDEKQPAVAIVFEEDEVLEQYRMLAHHEARQLVQEKLGNVLNKPRPLSSEEKPVEYEVSMPSELTAVMTLPKSTTDKLDIKPLQSTSFIPPLFSFSSLSRLPRPVNLLQGRLLNGEDRSSRKLSKITSKKVLRSYSEVQVVCQKCQKTMAVGYLAIMAQCPACAFISPATWAEHA